MKKIEEFSKLSISVEFNDMLLRNLIHGFREQYAIIIGRRSSLTINNRLMLERLNKDYQDIRIITFDTLFTDKLDHNKSVILSSAWTTSDIRKSENAFVVK